jgi:hypothetical protein
MCGESLGSIGNFPALFIDILERAGEAAWALPSPYRAFAAFDRVSSKKIHHFQ